MITGPALPDPVTDLLTPATTASGRPGRRRRTGTPPLAWSICRRYRLHAADAQHAAQTAWHKLADHLGSRTGAAALPGWLAITTRRECGRIQHRPGHHAWASDGRGQLSRARRAGHPSAR